MNPSLPLVRPRNIPYLLEVTLAVLLIHVLFLLTYPPNIRCHLDRRSGPL